MQQPLWLVNLLGNTPADAEIARVPCLCACWCRRRPPHPPPAPMPPTPVLLPPCAMQLEKNYSVA